MKTRSFQFNIDLYRWIATAKSSLCALGLCAVGTFTHVVYAQGPEALDDITIRVIGLDEIPKTTMQVIELPEPDLGEMNDIREGVSSRLADVRRERGEMAGVDASRPENGNDGGGAEGSTDTATPAPAPE